MIDRIDRNILRVLQEDGRITNLQLAQRCALSPSACLERTRRLKEQGYIQAFAYTDARGSYVPAAEVVERDGKFYWRAPDGEIEVFQEFGKIGN